jgi:hypothetical protein
MRVCAERHPIEVRLDAIDADTAADGRPRDRVSCWLHGPEPEIPPGGTEPLKRQEIAVADEA